MDPDDFNVIDSIAKGKGIKAAKDEREYTSKRRAVEDPYKDSELLRQDKARNDLVRQYGPQAGDPIAFGQVTGTQRAQDLHPAAVTAADLKNDATVIENDSASIDRDMKRKGAPAAISELEIGAFKNYLKRIKAGMPISAQAKAALGMDEASEQGVMEALGKHPGGAQQGAADMLIAMGDPAKLREIIEGVKPSTGKRVSVAIPENQAPGEIPDFAPDPKYNPTAGSYTLGGALRFDKNGNLITDATKEVAALQGAKAGEVVKGKDQASSQIEYPEQKMRTDLFVGVLDDLIADPGLKAIVGMPGLEKVLQGGPGGLTDFMKANSVLPGTPAANAMVKMRRVQDLAKLQGIAFYDGKGSLSNAEGETAGNAIVPLFTQGDYATTVRAMQGARKAQFDSLELLRQRSQGAPPVAAAPQAKALSANAMKYFQ